METFDSSNQDQHLVMKASQTHKFVPYSGAECSSAAKKRIFTKRYLECMKNHAIALGGHATDGCREFIPAGEEGSVEALKCAACSCHRNFHRKEIKGDVTYEVHPQPLSQVNYYDVPLPTGNLHVSPVSKQTVVTHEDVGHNVRDEQVFVVSPASDAGEKKRFRTKFTSEQKARMLSFAERVGWKIRKEKKGLAEEFCEDIGINMRVLKVWLNNNKNTLGKKH